MSSSGQPFSNESELAALIAEQEQDEKWGHRARPRGVSLDFEFEGGGKRADIVGYDTGAGETAVRRIKRPQKWTRREIIKHIRAWVKEHGELPKYKDWNKPNGRGIPSSASLERHFGTFDEAIRAAGFEPRGVGGSPRQQSTKKYGRKRIRRIKSRARLSSDQLAAAYLLYQRQNLSTDDLGELLWERYGYPNPNACAEALRHGFHAEGFRIRSRGEARRAMPTEKRREIYERMDAARPRKFTPQQVEEIRSLRGKVKQDDLAKRFGTTQSHISRIQLGRAYD